MFSMQSGSVLLKFHFFFFTILIPKRCHWLLFVGVTPRSFPLDKSWALPSPAFVSFVALLVRSFQVLGDGTSLLLLLMKIIWWCSEVPKHIPFLAPRWDTIKCRCFLIESTDENVLYPRLLERGEHRGHGSWAPVESPKAITAASGMWQETVGQGYLLSFPWGPGGAPGSRVYGSGSGWTQGIAINGSSDGERGWI